MEFCHLFVILFFKEEAIFLKIRKFYLESKLINIKPFDSNNFDSYIWSIHETNHLFLLKKHIYHIVKI